MRKVCIILGILCGAALAFILCGGVSMAMSLKAAMDANTPAPIHAAE